MQGNWRQRVLRSGLMRTGLSLCPLALTQHVLRERPILARLYPRNRRVMFHRYLGQYTVAIDTDYPVEREMLSGGYDHGSSALIRGLVRPGDVCLDIGANVGALTLLLADLVGEKGRVLAFEPGPPTYAKLQRNLSFNPVLAARTTALNVGLGERPGVLHWNEDAQNPGNADLLAIAGTPVPVTTVDTCLVEQGLPAVDFVKIDVEGMEWEVIQGGLQTWSRHRPVIYYESMTEFERSRGKPLFAPIRQMLSSLGYAHFGQLPDGRLQTIESQCVAMNSLAVPPERLRDIQLRVRLAA